MLHIKFYGFHQQVQRYKRFVATICEDFYKNNYVTLHVDMTNLKLAKLVDIKQKYGLQILYNHENNISIELLYPNFEK